jgi:hypothetical protein
MRIYAISKASYEVISPRLSLYMITATFDRHPEAVRHDSRRVSVRFRACMHAVTADSGNHVCSHGFERLGFVCPEDMSTPDVHTSTNCQPANSCIARAERT